MARNELRWILSLEQQARLALFEERFEAGMGRTIQDLRQLRQGIIPLGREGVMRQPSKTSKGLNCQAALLAS